MSSRQRLWSLRLEIPAESAEGFASALGDAPLALTVLAPPRRRMASIEALYAEKPDLPALTAALAVAAALTKTKPPKLHIHEMPQMDWLRKVASDFPPLPIARWIVHGAQHRQAVPDRRRALEIDATSAFGTGEHLTTRGCLLMLDKLLKGGFRAGRALDMGCGSGILAMAWAQVEHGRALGVDNDADSVTIAHHNARANGLAARVRIARGQGYGGFPVRKKAPYGLVMANIFARPLATMAKDLRRVLRPGGMAILSGFLGHQVNLVLAAHRIQKLYPVAQLRLGEWRVLVLTRRRR